jgi:hypothetical protein
MVGATEVGNIVEESAEATVEDVNLDLQFD